MKKVQYRYCNLFNRQPRMVVVQIVLFQSLLVGQFNLQHHYDFGRGIFTSTAEFFFVDNHGSTFGFADINHDSHHYSKKGATDVYFEVARYFALPWMNKNLSFTLQYNDGAIFFPLSDTSLLSAVQRSWLGASATPSRWRGLFCPPMRWCVTSRTTVISPISWRWCGSTRSVTGFQAWGTWISGTQIETARSSWLQNLSCCIRLGRWRWAWKWRLRATFPEHGISLKNTLTETASRQKGNSGSCLPSLWSIRFRARGPPSNRVTPLRWQPVKVWKRYLNVWQASCLPASGVDCPTKFYEFLKLINQSCPAPPWITNSFFRSNRINAPKK